MAIPPSWVRVGRIVTIATACLLLIQGSAASSLPPRLTSVWNLTHPWRSAVSGCSNRAQAVISGYVGLADYVPRHAATGVPLNNNTAGNAAAWTNAHSGIFECDGAIVITNASATQLGRLQPGAMGYDVATGDVLFNLTAVYPYRPGYSLFVVHNTFFVIETSEETFNTVNASRMRLLQRSCRTGQVVRNLTSLLPTNRSTYWTLQGMNGPDELFLLYDGQLRAYSVASTDETKWTSMWSFTLPAGVNPPQDLYAVVTSSNPFVRDPVVVLTWYVTNVFAIRAVNASSGYSVLVPLTTPTGAVCNSATFQVGRQNSEGSADRNTSRLGLVLAVTCHTEDDDTQTPGNIHVYAYDAERLVRPTNSASETPVVMMWNTTLYVSSTYDPLSVQTVPVDRRFFGVAWNDWGAHVTIFDWATGIELGSWNAGHKLYSICAVAAPDDYSAPTATGGLLGWVALGHGHWLQTQTLNCLQVNAGVTF